MSKPTATADRKSRSRGDYERYEPDITPAEKAKRQKALENLTAQALELGMYDEFFGEELASSDWMER